MSFWKDKKVLVTGGSGFIGSHLTEMLLEAGSRVRITGRSPEKFFRHLGLCRNEVEFFQGDLTNLDFCLRAGRGMDYVMHLAAHVGGVGYNISRAGSLFFANVLMNANVMEASIRSGATHYLCVSSACVYPRAASIPTPEEEGFKDDPEPTNLGYGWAKRVAEVQARCYSHQYQMKIAIARPYNAYGPRDNFGWESSHVIPSLIRKVVEKQNPVMVWGDGEQSRAFVYVTDVARGLTLCLEKYARADPVNIGAAEEIKIRDLISLIMELSGEKLEVVFDRSKPSGQPRRQADISKAKNILGYETRVTLKEGLQSTIEWYRRNRQAPAP